MRSLDPPEVTPQAIRDRLRKGLPVYLDEPGWADTPWTRCPACHDDVKTFRAEPSLLFHYGVTCAYPHICHAAEPPVVPRVIAQELARQWDQDQARIRRPGNERVE